MITLGSERVNRHNTKMHFQNLFYLWHLQSSQNTPELSAVGRSEGNILSGAIVAVPMFCLFHFFGLKLILIRLAGWCVTYRSKVLARETKRMITVPVGHDTQLLVDNYSNCEEYKLITYIVNNSSR